MNSLTLTTEKGRMRLTFPDRYDELTLEQIIKIESLPASDPLTIFSILTGLELKFAEKLDAKLEPVIWESIAFMFDNIPEWGSLKPPRMLVIDGKPCNVPRPEKLSIGQSIMVTELLNKSETLFDVIPEALAIYFDTVVSGGTFDRFRVPALRDKVMQCNGVEAMAVAGFFLTGSKNWRYTMPLLSRLLKTTLQRYSRITVVTRSTGVLCG
jgi:hypothetical protein